MRARIIPIGRMARNAMEKYLQISREQFVRGRQDEPHLFVNCRGSKITRQGLWKILKEYGEAAERMKNVMDAAEKCGSGNASFYTAAYYYLSGRAQGLSDRETEAYLEKLFDKGILEKTLYCLADAGQVLLRQYSFESGMDGKANSEADAVWKSVRSRVKREMRKTGR